MMKIGEIVRSKLTLVLIFICVGLSGVAASYAYFANKSNVRAVVQCEDLCVSLRDDQAVPATLAIETGSTVQFNSADGEPHSLSLGSGGEEHSHTGTFSSGRFESDEAWRVQFHKEGSYLFHDHFNPKISVLVVVYAPGKDYRIE